ncbi:hypothetical protein BOO71_0013909 [Deinococcus marmoris]|uniref:Uncharacterized protein n=1 Tax=Deinococcus marmoris TaxID=249408 RepID=A0A1U7NS65_9DEIO|nr:hypothetical protein BOO71_0013909 [Deinococcus marmoris]
MATRHSPGERALIFGVDLNVCMHPPRSREKAVLGTAGARYQLLLPCS